MEMGELLGVMAVSRLLPRRSFLISTVLCARWHRLCVLAMCDPSQVILSVPQFLYLSGLIINHACFSLTP